MSFAFFTVGCHLSNSARPAFCLTVQHHYTEQDSECGVENVNTLRQV